MIIKTGKELAGEIRETNVPYGSFAYWWLGQLGYAMKFGETVIYVDAYLSPSTARQIEPLMSVSDMAGAALVLGTHDHSDHIDSLVWKELPKLDKAVKFVAPAPLAADVGKRFNISDDRLIHAADGKPFESCGLKITPIAAAHELVRYIDGQSEFLSYIIEGNGCKILHTGDSCIYEGYLTALKAFGQLDAVFLPINGRDAVRYKRGCIGNMTYQEAADLVGSLTPKLTVPGHYEMFKDNSCDVTLFRDYLQVKYPGLECRIGGHGEQVSVSG